MIILYNIIIYYLKTLKGFRVVYNEILIDDDPAQEDHPYCSQNQMAVFVGYETNTEEKNLGEVKMVERESDCFDLCLESDQCRAAVYDSGSCVLSRKIGTLVTKLESTIARYGTLRLAK